MAICFKLPDNSPIEISNYPFGRFHIRVNLDTVFYIRHNGESWIQDEGPSQSQELISLVGECIVMLRESWRL